MKSQIRSTTGCWICKLRKKKCDEAKPACSACTSLKLECSGYGVRPEWMDGGTLEKEMTSKIRDTVKQVTSQKKRAAMQQRQRPAEDQIWMGYQFSDPRLFNPVLTPPQSSPHVASTPQGKPLLLDGPPINPTPAEAAAYILRNESVLLMHYLDNVFPQQFQFFRPSFEEGGRGWLLDLLMQTKPLYHAALSLAAYHRQMTYCLRGGMSKACFTQEALHLQYDVAITELRLFLQPGNVCDLQQSLKCRIQLMCSIVLCISIEGFTTSTEAWSTHLQAAITLLPDIHTQLNTTTPTEMISPTFRSAFCFFASAVSWYGIVSCATLGPSSFRVGCHEIAEEYVHFDKVMGCENWAMLAIKDIVALDYWKNKLKASGRLSMRELVSRGNQIEARLTQGLVLGSDMLTAGKSPDFLKADQGGNATVTKIYCCAALVYLHVVMSGAFPDLLDIRQNVATAIEAFQALPDPELVNSLIWPLCITACLAGEEYYEIFRALSQTGSPKESNFGALKTRTIFEECWRLRELDPESGKVDWRTAVDSLNFHILLI